MKYLVVVRGFNEADNNTPSDEIWTKITDIEPSDLPKYEKIYTSEFIVGNNKTEMSDVLTLDLAERSDGKYKIELVVYDMKNNYRLWRLP